MPKNGFFYLFFQKLACSAKFLVKKERSTKFLKSPLEKILEPPLALFMFRLSMSSTTSVFDPKNGLDKVLRPAQTRNNHRAQPKHTSITVQIYFQLGRNKPRARFFRG